MVIRILLGVLIGGVIGAVVGYFGKCSSGACPLTANPYRGAIYGAVVGALLQVGEGSQQFQGQVLRNLDEVADGGQGMGGKGGLTEKMPSYAASREGVALYPCQYR